MACRRSHWDVRSQTSGPRKRKRRNGGRPAFGSRPKPHQLGSIPRWRLHSRQVASEETLGDNSGLGATYTSLSLEQSLLLGSINSLTVSRSACDRVIVYKLCLKDLERWPALKTPIHLHRNIWVERTTLVAFLCLTCYVWQEVCTSLFFTSRTKSCLSLQTRRFEFSLPALALSVSLKSLKNTTRHEMPNGLRKEN